MPVLTIAKTYANGNTLFAVDLDNAFNSISTLLNTTLLDSANVQTGGLIGTDLANGTIGNAQLGSACVNTANLASSAVTTAILGPLAVTTANIASSAITTTALTGNLNLPGKSVQAGNNNIVVSNTNATTSLAIIRGNVNTAGGITSGEGFSVVRNSTGQYTITFTIAFADVPSIAMGADVGRIATTNFPLGSSSFIVSCYGGATPADTNFSFIATGQRA